MLLKNYSIKLLEKKFKIESDVRVRERLQMILHLREGYTQREVSSMLRISVGIVPFWKKRFEEEGFDGLEDKEGRGLKPGLDEEELSMLAYVLENGLPMDDGYTRGLKTKDVTEFIENNFNKKYTTRHCRRVLDNIGCSLQVPRPRHKRRNQEAVDKFKREFKKNEKVWTMI